MKKCVFSIYRAKLQRGQSLIELLLAIGVSAIILPALFLGFIGARQGKAQQYQRIEAIYLQKEAEEAIRSVREQGWNSFAVNGTYHPVISGSTWTLASGSEVTNGFTRQIIISDVSRDTNGTIVSTGGTIDPSTKKVAISVTWSSPLVSTISSSLYLTRFLDNLSYSNSTVAEFNTGTQNQVQITNTSGGEVALALNNKAKWCSPAFSSSSIDLPDGPPVSLSARASATSSAIPNDVFVATSPYATNSAKLAYVKVTANTDPPVSTLQGTFTMDASKYSNASYVPTGTGLTNSFTTNAVKYYTSSAGKLYALIATNLPDKEIVVVQINDGTTDAYQDPVNKIYKYWTYFNTRRYQGDVTSTPNQDQAPFGYGATSLSILGTKGYMTSGGYLYTFDLSNIDTKSKSNGLDEVGCRIELDGYDCNPGSGTDMKYTAGQTGASWSNTTSPSHLDCSDGGNIELHADNDIFPIQVGANTYVYVAVGAATNPELNIVNVTSIPTANTTPKISSNSCGTSSGGNAGWKKVSSLDFNSAPGTEEAANSVFVKSDGTRAYMSSNGGIFAGGGPNPDSWQFYVLDTSNKLAPKFLSGTQNATSGYYYGTSPNDQLFPRRSLTVLNGQRAVLVGKDGFPNDNLTPKTYQVLDITNEATPTYCGGLDFPSGFNDLTSVSEADNDNFVYMVTNTTQKQLKIIQGGPDGTYIDQGTFESPILDVGYSTAFNTYSASFTQPTNTSVKVQFSGADPVNGSCTGATYTYTGPDGTGSSYYTASTSAILLNSNGSGYKNPARCFRYKAFLATTDYNATPLLNDITINYSP